MITTTDIPFVFELERRRQYYKNQIRYLRNSLGKITVSDEGCYLLSLSKDKPEDKDAYNFYVELMIKNQEKKLEEIEAEMKNYEVVLEENSSVEPYAAEWQFKGEGALVKLKE